MSLASCCATGFKHEGTASGSLSTVGGLPTYSVGQEYGWDNVIVIFTDIFGYKFINNQLMADQLSRSGKVQVLIPDILEGDAVEDFGSVDLQAWFQNHDIGKISKFVDTFLKDIISKHSPKSLFGIGHCFGAPFVLKNLAKDGNLTRGAIAHPSRVVEEDVEKVVKPLLISCGPEDVVFTTEIRNKTVEILTKNNLFFQLELFAGADHGFQIRGDISKPHIRYAKEKTTFDQITFFQYKLD